MKCQVSKKAVQKQSIWCKSKFSEEDKEKFLWLQRQEAVYTPRSKYHRAIRQKACKSISAKQKAIKQTHLGIAKRLTASTYFKCVFASAAHSTFDFTHTRRILLSFGFKSIQAEARVCSHSERSAPLIPDAFIKVPRLRVQTLLSLYTKSIFPSATAAVAAVFCLRAKSVNVASSKFHTPMLLLIDFPLKLIIRASRAAQILSSLATLMKKFRFFPHWKVNWKKMWNLDRRVFNKISSWLSHSDPRNPFQKQQASPLWPPIPPGEQRPFLWYFF